MAALTRLNITPELIKTIVKEYSNEQIQTKDTFAYKWSKRETYESDDVQQNTRNWLFERYCNNNPEKLKAWLAGGKKIILDAGCGSGFAAILFFGNLLKDHDYLGIDISNAVEVAKLRFSEKGFPGDFIQVNLLDAPLPDNSIDLIFSEGVLHHTDDTEKSLIFLSKKLKKGGRILFYVYAKKAIIREFTDDWIRDYLSSMTDGEAWEALKPLTRLGIYLGKLNLEIDVPEDIPFLGINKGKQNLQRFFYWNIFKAYYRQEYSMEEMNHINFDWYRPLNCHRHTKQEIETFCKNANLEIESINIQPSGITVVGKKVAN